MRIAQVLIVACMLGLSVSSEGKAQQNCYLSCHDCVSTFTTQANGLGPPTPPDPWWRDYGCQVLSYWCPECNIEFGSADNIGRTLLSKGAVRHVADVMREHHDRIFLDVKRSRLVVLANSCGDESTQVIVSVYFLNKEQVGTLSKLGARDLAELHLPSARSVANAQFAVRAKAKSSTFSKPNENGGS